MKLAADIGEPVRAPLTQRPRRFRRVLGIGWRREIERLEQQLGGFGIELALHHAHPAQRRRDTEPAPFEDPACVLAVVDDAAPVAADRGDVGGAQRTACVEERVLLFGVLLLATAHHRRQHLDVRARHLTRSERGPGAIVAVHQPRPRQDP